MPELLAPAGNFEKLKAAVLYGADAVYLAGKMFGMRAAADNFEPDEIKKAVKFAHEHNVKIYLTVNTMPRDPEYPLLKEYLLSLKNSGLDALIISDLGVFSLTKELLPETPVHISTQASTVSAAACRMWHSLGASRVVLARELSLDDMARIRDNTPPELELEAFIHGSMCIAYSGRCLLSNCLVGRDSNRGQCAQPCRWNYTLRTEIVEEKRPDTPLIVEESKNGTFIMSSKDMCMIEHIPELMKSGIDSFKIEGRMKSAYYAAVVTNSYRMAIDHYLASPSDYRFNPDWLRELMSVSHREYCTGYWFDSPADIAQVCSSGGYIREKAYLATALSYDKDSGTAQFIQRNKLIKGQKVELISPGKTGMPFLAEKLWGADGEPLDAAPHPGMHFTMEVPIEIKPGDILRSGE
ncbi:MAG: U32 family peptidase [Clostridiales bacterium]|nr:U32 family peptidase [Clostridiales bacterium]